MGNLHARRLARLGAAPAAVMAMAMAVLAPAPALAQATTYQVGVGTPPQLEHQVTIANCCTNFAHASDNTPQANLSISGPPWPAPYSQYTGEYGSAQAASKTTVSAVSSAGVSFTATVSTASTPGTQGGLRASASQGGTYYLFTLDAPSYVELHGSFNASGSRGGLSGAAGSLSLRAGSSGGSIIGGAALSFIPNSSTQNDTVTLHVGPILLTAGTYVVVGSTSATADGSGTWHSENAFGTLSATLSLHSDPDGAPVGTFTCADSAVTVSHSGGPVAVAAGHPIYMGDVIETGPASRACIAFADDTQFTLSENSRIRVDEYVYDASSHEGQAHYSIMAGFFRYLSGLIEKKPDPNVAIDTPYGTIGIRGTELIGQLGADHVVVHLKEGQVAPVPRNGAGPSLVTGPSDFTFDAATVTTGAFSQGTYDSLLAALGLDGGGGGGGGGDTAPAITSAASAAFTARSFWSFTVATTASPVAAISVAGALPEGVTFTDNGDGTGTLAGTASLPSAGVYSLTIAAGNGIVPVATRVFTLTVQGGFAIEKTAQLADFVAIGSGTVIKKGVTIGPRTVIGGNVTINQGVRIGADVHIGSNTLVDQYATIGDAASIGIGVSIGQYASIGAGVVIPDGGVVRARTSVK